MVDFIHSKSKFRTILHIQKYKLFSVLYISMCKSAAKLQKKFWNMQIYFAFALYFGQFGKHATKSIFRLRPSLPWKADQSIAPHSVEPYGVLPACQPKFDR